LYVLFFIELGSRRVHFAGCTMNPLGARVVQHTRNLSFTSVLERTRFLIHDHDSKFTTVFDEVFRSEGITVIHTPVQAPQANATRSGSSAPNVRLATDHRPPPLELGLASTSSTTTMSGRTANSRSIRLNRERERYCGTVKGVKTLFWC
jgi:hypothetical protein